MYLIHSTSFRKDKTYLLGLESRELVYHSHCHLPTSVYQYGTARRPIFKTVHSYRCDKLSTCFPDTSIRSFSNLQPAHTCGLCGKLITTGSCASVSVCLSSLDSHDVPAHHSPWRRGEQRKPRAAIICMCTLPPSLLHAKLHTLSFIYYHLIPQSPNSQLGSRLPVQDYDKERRSGIKTGKLFEDPYFPADESSLFFSQKLPFKPVWKRPKVWQRLLESGGRVSMQCSF